jgi:hypothetical protein
VVYAADLDRVGEPGRIRRTDGKFTGYASDGQTCEMGAAFEVSDQQELTDERTVCPRVLSFEGANGGPTPQFSNTSPSASRLPIARRFAAHRVITEIVRDFPAVFGA